MCYYHLSVRRVQTSILNSWCICADLYPTMYNTGQENEYVPIIMTSMLLESSVFCVGVTSETKMLSLKTVWTLCTNLPIIALSEWYEYAFI